MADEIIRNVIPNMKAVDLGDGTFAYATVGETAQDRGIATGGSNVTCIDTTKAWIVNSFIGDTLQVTVAGVEYHSLITANTANTITMNIIGAVVVAGDPYKIVSAVGAAATIADGADVTQGAIADAVVVAGAAGTLSAKFRRLTADLGAGIVDLAAIEIINTAIQTAVQGMQAVDGAVGVAADVDGVRPGQLRYMGEALNAIQTALALSDGAVTMAHTDPAIAAGTTLALAANANREYAMFINDSNEVIYMKVGVVAVQNEGIRLNASGGSYEMNRQIGNLDTRVVNAICASGGKELLVTEGV